MRLVIAEKPSFAKITMTAIRSIPEVLCDPVMTAEWEAKLAKIVEGSLIIDDFEDEIKEFVTQQVSLALQS